MIIKKMSVAPYHPILWADLASPRTVIRRIQLRFLKYFFTAGVFLIGTTLTILVTPPRFYLIANAWPQQKTQARGQANTQNKSEGKKTGGIVGDPSRQRGFELGYDAGPKAGNQDKAQNKKPDPFLRPEYVKPEQFYRYEFGSRVLFIAGFRNGFLRGYKSSFGKTELKRTESPREIVSINYPHMRNPLIESTKAHEAPSKKITITEDAL